MTKAAEDVLHERARQQEREGWTPEHDDTHVNFELSRAALAYLARATHKEKTRADNAKLPFAPGGWPWAFAWWKPGGRRRDLVRAAALIIAEIERLDRAAKTVPAEEWSLEQLLAFLEAFGSDLEAKREVPHMRLVWQVLGHTSNLRACLSTKIAP